MFQQRYERVATSGTDARLRWPPFTLAQVVGVGNATSTAPLAPAVSFYFAPNFARYSHAGFAPNSQAFCMSFFALASSFTSRYATARLP